MIDQEAKTRLLREVYGHTGFRPGQEELVDALLQGRDVVGIMPTGAGKSLCYQIPALMLEGTALVISPLISLMKDQVASLKAAGVSAAYINSSLTPAQQELALQRARQGAYRIIYVAPERLDTPSFRRTAAALRISLIAVDEAHCVSQWGQDFRPTYLHIPDFIRSLPQRPPVGAFTATATERVRQDMLRLLELQDPRMVTTGFDRPNLFLEIIPVSRKRDQVLLRLLEEIGSESGIVYCATRRHVDQVCGFLNVNGFSAVRYHAGMPDEMRRKSQEDFQYDRAQIMVATNAFGMGIDKSNVRFVIHYQMPASLEAYYQEAGRAGRDGDPADCVLLFSRQDIMIQRHLLEHSEPNPELTPQEQETLRRMDEQRLREMIRYCEQTGCLHGTLMRYFGQTAAENCQSCCHCRSPHFPLTAEFALNPSDRRQRARREKTPPQSVPSSAAQDQEIFERLRECRTRLAAEIGQPPYIICADKTLRDMAQRMPATPLELLQVYGMGRRKVERYGDAFLAALNNKPVSVESAESKPDEPPAPVRQPSSREAAAQLLSMACQGWTEEQENELRQARMQGSSIAELSGRFSRSREELVLKLLDLSLIE